MYRIVRQLVFCYGHRLMDYQGKCSRAHGHNAVAEIEIGGAELDHRGIVVDFGDVKALLGRFIDEELDHRMLLRQDDPLVEAMESAGESVYRMPVNPTAENIAALIYEKGRELGLPVSSVRLWETGDSFAEYRPDADNGGTIDPGGVE